MKFFRFMNWWVNSLGNEELALIFIVVIPCLLIIISGILVFFTHSIWAISLLPVYIVAGLVLHISMYISNQVREYKKMKEQEAETIVRKLRTGR